MASDPKHPKVGDKVIDASDVDLIDLPTEQLNKLTKLRPGFEKAVRALLNLTTDQLDALGLNPNRIGRLGKVNGEESRLAELQDPAAKLAEMIKETRQERRHEIAGILGEAANQVRRSAKRLEKGSELLGPLEDLLDYWFGPAETGAATRAKNAEEKAAAGGTPEDGKPEDPKTGK